MKVDHHSSEQLGDGSDVGVQPININQTTAEARTTSRQGSKRTKKGARHGMRWKGYNFLERLRWYACVNYTL